MKPEYDLSKMKSRRNPYASKLKKPVTMRLSEDVVAYFKGIARRWGRDDGVRSCITTYPKSTTGSDSA